jgi:hypothetical protein
MIPSGESGPDTVMKIHHTRHTVKPEPVKLILFHPEPQIAQQEAQNFMVAVVEQSTVPKFVTAFATFMEVLVVSAIKLVQTVKDVFAGMRMNNIEQNGEAHSVGSVNEFFEVFRSAVAGAGSEEARHLISER